MDRFSDGTELRVEGHIPRGHAKKGGGSIGDEWRAGWMLFVGLID